MTDYTTAATAIRDESRTATDVPRSTAAPAVTAPHLHAPSRLREVRTMVWRNLKHIRRQPEMLADVTIQPIMFVLLFAFVFGSSIQTPGSGYREWLLPGIMAQTMAFSSFVVAIGLTADIGRGIVDRFRSLPISRSSVLVGRSISSLLHSSIGIVVMSVTGLAIGWRIHEGFAKAVLAFGLLLLFGFAMIWLGILVGSKFTSVEGVNGFMFTTMFPITFLANTFAPTDNMTPWLRTIAEWNPISALVQALRELWGNAPAAGPDAAWPLQHPVLVTVVWSVGLAIVFAPLAIRAFVKRTED
ncbi:ABC transporter [Intrasporangium oryzae NRRL B-24470]|uniref:Transport permease protein n=1 Tax=Intrasporangium oryzae NRRL B-24470 TaxID=1386089 RepID=W9GDG4_9MICO|nr:ABC transporter permease [Intrasporangium oryzae]EWT03257.1 ABC transporter [Intrasporangium oryzae NRRL B-24470]